MSNRKEIQTHNHTIKYIGLGVSIVGFNGHCTILTDDEIDLIHGLKEANRKLLTVLNQP